MKRTLGLFAFVALASVFLQAQSARPDGLYLGSKAKHVTVLGGLDVAGGTDGGGVYTPLAKADVVDAGQIFAQGFGPITRIIPFTTAAIDFASQTIVCEDAAATAVTGVRVNDPCFVSVPSTFTAGGTGLHHTFSCYVGSTGNVTVRACPAGTADNPGSATFSGFVISSAQ